MAACTRWGPEAVEVEARGRWAAAAAKVEAATPPDRNRVVDLLRAAAIVVVVLGHWTIVAVDRQGISPHGVIDAARWLHPLTWLFQVMPVFFLVGGYSNALSWRSARRRGLGYGGWLRARLQRLGIPLMVLLLVWALVAVLAGALGVAPERLALDSQMALIPTWFLASYLLVIVVAPACLVLWERFGWWSIVGGIALAGVVDLVSITMDSPLAGYPNYLLVWAAFHQFGYAWLDGRLASARSRLTLAGIGAVGLAVLVGFGPYPVSMITAAGDAISNSSPTRITMAALGMVQAAVVLGLAPALERWLRRPRAWFVTVAVNRRIMSLFLWHLTAMVAVSELLLSIGGPGLGLRPLSGAWWATRPLWWLVLAVATAVLVAVFGRFEEPAVDSRPEPAAWRPVIAAVGVCTGLAVLAGSGMVGPGGLGWLWALLPPVALLVTGVVSPRMLIGAALPRTRDGRNPDA